MSELQDVAGQLRDAITGHLEMIREASTRAADSYRKQEASLSAIAVKAQRLVALTEATSPPPGPDPEIPNRVRIGTAVPYPIAGVDPTPESNPAGWTDPTWQGRGPDQLIVLTDDRQTNPYGFEVGVAGGLVATWGVNVPRPDTPGAYRLSGHGAGRDHMVRYATLGAIVELTREDDPPPPPPPTGTALLSVYVKMWANARQPSLATCARPGINEIRLAFLQGSPPRIVGWGSQDADGVKTDCATLRDRGVAINASVGGAGGAVDMRSREAFLGGMGAFHAQIGLDRWDLDVEASDVNGDDVLAIAQAAHDRWGLKATMAPNGSNVDRYLPIGVELARRGLLAAYGQQFYDAKVPLGSPNPADTGSAMGRIAQAVKAGIPAHLLQVGMMVGSNTAKYWPLATCAANMAAIKAQWPDILGAYLWSETQADVASWAESVGAAWK